MWYLGNAMPLQAGSAATTENFIRAILKLNNFSIEPFKKMDIAWDFLVALVSRQEFAKQFVTMFENYPSREKYFSPTVNIFRERQNVQQQRLAGTIASEETPLKSTSGAEKEDSSCCSCLFK